MLPKRTTRLTLPRTSSGSDVSEGMESSVNGGRRVKNIRSSINSYMFGNAYAIAHIAAMAGKGEIEREYRAKAGRFKALVEERLWNPPRPSS